MSLLGRGMGGSERARMKRCRKNWREELNDMRKFVESALGYSWKQQTIDLWQQNTLEGSGPLSKAADHRFMAAKHPWRQWTTLKSNFMEVDHCWRQANISSRSSLKLWVNLDEKLWKNLQEKLQRNPAELSGKFSIHWFWKFWTFWTDLNLSPIKYSQTVVTETSIENQFHLSSKKNLMILHRFLDKTLPSLSSTSSSNSSFLSLSSAVLSVFLFLHL
jgi:hypothetical protein